MYFRHSSAKFICFLLFDFGGMAILLILQQILQTAHSCYPLSSLSYTLASTEGAKGPLHPFFRICDYLFYCNCYLLDIEYLTN